MFQAKRKRELELSKRHCETYREAMVSKYFESAISVNRNKSPSQGGGAGGVILIARRFNFGLPRRQKIKAVVLELRRGGII